MSLKNIDIEYKKIENETIPENIPYFNKDSNLDQVVDLLGDDLKKITIEQQGDEYIFKLDGTPRFVVEGNEAYNTVISLIEEHFKGKYQLNFLDLEEDVESNNSTKQTKKAVKYHKQEVIKGINLPKQNLETLEKLYEDPDFPKQVILDLIKEKLLKASFPKRLAFLRRNKEKGLDLFYYGLVEIIKNLKGRDQAKQILDTVGAENIQAAIKNYVAINDDFADSYWYYYNSSRFSFTCKGRNISPDACRSVGSYIWALGGGKKGIVDMDGISYLLFQSFGNDLQSFANTIETGIKSYQDVKGKLPSEMGTILKKEGLVGVVSHMLDKTKMSEGQKGFWLAASQIGAIVGLIWKLFKIASKNGIKGLLFLIGSEFALEASTGQTSLDLLGKLMYGGFDMDELTKKGVKKGKENKEYANLIGHPSFVNAMIGDKKLKDIKKYCKFENGNIKSFDVEKFMKDLPNDDWRKALLLKIGVDKVGKIFVAGLSGMGLVSETDFNQDKKVSDIYKKYLKDMEKRAQQAQQNSSNPSNSSNSPNSSNPSNPQGIFTPSTNSVEGHGNNSNIGNHGNNSDESRESNEEQSSGNEHVVVIEGRKHPISIGKEKVLFSGKVNKLQSFVDDKFKEKLGEKLFKKLNEKLKLLSNLQLFMDYMKKYAEYNNYDFDVSHWWERISFNASSNILDEKPIFIKGAHFPSYKILYEHIMLAVIKGDKIKVNKLLGLLDDKKILSALKNIDGEIVKKYEQFFLSHIVDTPMDEETERESILNMLKTGNRLDIDKFFAEKMKTTDFIENDTISQVLLKGLDLKKLINLNLEESTEEAYNKLTNNFYIAGKKINFDGNGLTKDDVRDILKDVRKDTANYKIEQRQKYIYGLLVGKQLQEGKDAILSQIEDENIKKQLGLYYKYSSDWSKFKQHWRSIAVKGGIMLGAIIISDGIVTSLIPEGAALGWGGLQFATRVAALQNVAGDMSLLLNDQLNKKNVLNVATDLNGYIHTAAYMGVLEVFGAVSKGLSKTKAISSISGKLETLGTGGKVVKSLSLYGFNVAGLFTIDTLVFDGEFTPEEVMNVLIFAMLMGKPSIKAKKTIDGEIKIIENNIKSRKSKVESIKKSLEGKKISAEIKVNTLEKQLKDFKDKVENRIKTIENDKGKIEKVLSKMSISFKRYTIEKILKSRKSTPEKYKEIKKTLENYSPWFKANKRVKNLILDILGDYERLKNIKVELGKDPKDVNVANIEREINLLNGSGSIKSEFKKLYDPSASVDLITELKKAKQDLLDINNKLSRADSLLSKLSGNSYFVQKVSKLLEKGYFGKDVKKLPKGEFKLTLKDGTNTFEVGYDKNIKKYYIKDGSTTWEGDKKDFLNQINSVLGRKIALNRALLEKSIIDSIKTEKYKDKITGTDYLKGPKFKFGDKDYIITKKDGTDEYYIIEKDSTGVYKIGDAKKIEDFIKENPYFLLTYEAGFSFRLFAKKQHAMGSSSTINVASRTGIVDKWPISTVFNALKEGKITLKKVFIEHPSKSWTDLKTELGSSYKDFSKDWEKFPTAAFDTVRLPIKQIGILGWNELTTVLKYVFTGKANGGVGEVLKNIGISAGMIGFIGALQEFVQNPSDLTFNHFIESLEAGWDEIVSNKKDIAILTILFAHLKWLGLIGDVVYENWQKGYDYIKDSFGGVQD